MAENKVVAPCPKCRGAVLIMPTQGGRGSFETTQYSAACQACGHTVALGDTSGRKDAARREWNRIVR